MTWDRTPASETIGKHSNHDAKYYLMHSWEDAEKVSKKKEKEEREVSEKLKRETEGKKSKRK